MLTVKKPLAFFCLIGLLFGNLSERLIEKAEKDYPKWSKANHHVNNTWNHAHCAKNHGDKVKREKAYKQPVKRADNY